MAACWTSSNKGTRWVASECKPRRRYAAKTLISAQVGAAPHSRSVTEIRTFRGSPWATARSADELRLPPAPPPLSDPLPVSRKWLLHIFRPEVLLKQPVGRPYRSRHACAEAQIDPRRTCVA
jgi:hypothetical protein